MRARVVGVLVATIAVLASASGCGTTVAGAGSGSAALQSSSGGTGGTASLGGPGLTVPKVDSGTGNGTTQGGAPGTIGGSAGPTVATSGAVSGPPGGQRGGRVATNGAAGAGTRKTASWAGVTAGTITIGVVYLQGADQTASSFGISGLTTGDGQAQGKALVDYLNAHGGIAGRHVVPVYAAMSSSAIAAGNAPQAEQTICTSLTQDHHAFAVVSYVSFLDDNLAVCLKQHGAALIDDGTSTDRAAYPQVAGYLYLPSMLTLERLYLSLANDLIGRGFLTGRSRVGIQYADTTATAAFVDNVLKPYLASRGIRVVAQGGISTSASGTAQYSGLVLHFKTQRADRILSVANSPLLFMEEAQSQQYHPRYSVSSEYGPMFLTTAGAPAAQLHGAVGFGWWPVLDVDASRAPTVSSRETLCYQIMKRAGQDVGQPTTQYVMLQFCDAFFFLSDALKGAAAPTPQVLQENVRALGSRFVSSITFGTDFSSGRIDGVSRVRDLAYADACNCFSYTSGLRPI